MQKLKNAKSTYSPLANKLWVMLMSIVMTVFMLSEGITALAATTTDKTYALSGWGYDFRNSGLPNAYDPLTQSNTNNQFRYQWANEFYYFKNAEGKFCYCVQLGTVNVDGTTMEELDLENNAKDYYPDTNQARLLRHATIYSYKGTCKYGYNWEVELTASQALVWSISGKYFGSSTTTLSTNENTLLKCIKAPSTALWNDMKECYKKMKADVLDHGSIPSGMSTVDYGKPLDNATYQLKYNKSTCRWETTISMDSALSQFKLPSVSGVTFTRSGSKLKISATEAGRKNVENQILSLTKTKAKYANKIEECTSVFLAVKNPNSSSQAKISYTQGEDPVQAYFKLTSATGNLKINKQLLTSSGQKVNGTAEQYNSILFQLSFLDSDNVRHYLISTKDSDGVYTYANTTTDSSSSASLYRVGADGTLQIKGLPAGTFNLSEYKTADGFKLAGDVHVTVNADKTTSLTVKNSGTGSHIDVYKSAQDWNGSEIEDTALLEKIYSATKFRAYVIDNGVKKYITAEPDTQTGTEHSSERYFIANYTGLTDNVDNAAVLSLYSDYDGYYNTNNYSFFGTARLRNVPEELSRIYFEEIQSYDSFGFYNGNIKLSQNKNDVNFVNQAYHFRAGFNKYISGTETFLSDGVFGLYASENVYFNDTLIYAAGQEIERVDSNGSTTYFNTYLPAWGSYYIQEIEAPAGYIKDDTMYEVKANMPVQLTSSRLSDVVLNIENEEIRFAVSKQDAYGAEISGAQMQLIDETGVVVEEWTSAETEHIVSGLAAGSYTLHEYYAPDGYCIATDISVTIDEYGKIFADNTEVTAVSNDGLPLVVMIDEATKVEISKKDITGDDELPGATLQVIDKDGNVIEEWVSTEEAHYIEGVLIAGETYTLKETIAPNGYALTSDIEFTVNADGSVTYVVMYNSDAVGTVQIQKRTEGMMNVEGITLVLSGASDSGHEVKLTAVTDKDGFAAFTAVPVGTYTVTEDADTVPIAYMVADQLEITVYEAETVNAEIYNVEKSGTIEINKTTEGMTNLQGIEFILSGTSDSGRDIKITAVTDKNGIATFTSVPIGTYSITENEKTVPYAYLTAEPQEVSVFYAETTTVEINNEEKTGSIQIQKTTEGMTDLEGIEFILSGTSDSGREIMLTAVTDKDGKATFTSIPIGTYTITENGDTVPVGYMVADDQTVQVFYAETTNVVVNNEKIPETPSVPDTPPATGSAAVGIPAILLLGGFILSLKRKNEK
ncbi:SpaA isopeptide-forming pilin-related protein [Ruminococcus sp. Marseille-P6503]|uniref:SpaA isopeptide-forming pilin-related protein n=1 Tax=Ruminococcus sp. Marseille-P6503 TaxID=2364796 RepID=UPI000F52A408|nr:SpaA isopeptide-forming pilin-related protein [Ruminococcus sp. Marseille-P6503]